MPEQIAVYELRMQDKQFNANLKKSEKALRNFDKKTEKATKDIEKSFEGMIDPKKVQAKSKQMTAVIDRELKKQLKNVKGNKDAEERLIKATADKRVAIEKQAQNKINQLRQAGIKGGGGLGGIGGIMGGAVGGLGAFAGISGIQSVVSGITRTISEAGEAYDIFEDKIANIGTVTNENLNVIGETSRKTAQKYGVAVDDILDSIYFGFSAGTLKSSDDAERFSETVAKFSKATKQDMSEATQAISSFVNQTGISFENAADILAQVQKEGVLAQGELAQYASQAALSFENLGLSAEDYGAALANLTARGLKTPQVITGLRAIEKEFKNTDVLEKLKTAGVEGVDFINRKVTDFTALIQSLGEKGSNAVYDIFGNEEARRVLNVWASDTEGTMIKSIESFKNGTGTMKNMYSNFVGTSIDINQKFEASTHETMLQIGEVWSSVTTSMKSGLLGFFNLFADDLTKAQNAMTEWKGLSALTESFEQTGDIIGEALSSGNIDQALGAMSKNLDVIAEKSPYTAQLINEVLANPNQQTEENIRKIQMEINTLATMSEWETLEAKTEALRANSEMVANSWEESMKQIQSSMTSDLFDTSTFEGALTNTLAQVGQNIGDLIGTNTIGEAIVGDIDQVELLEMAIAKITKERDNYNNAIKAGLEPNETQREMYAQQGEELRKLMGMRGELNNAIETSVKNTVELENLDKESLEIARQKLLSNKQILDITKGRPELEKRITNELSKQLQNKQVQAQSDKIIDNIKKNIASANVRDSAQQTEIINKEKEKLRLLIEELKLRIANAQADQGVVTQQYTTALATGDTQQAGIAQKSMLENAEAIKKMNTELEATEKAFNSINSENNEILAGTEINTDNLGIQAKTLDELNTKKAEGVELTQQETELMKQLEQEQQRLATNQEIKLIKAELNGMDKDSIDYQRLLIQNEKDIIALLQKQGASELEILQHRLNLKNIEDKIKDIKKKQAEDADKRAKQEDERAKKREEQAKKDRQEEEDWLKQQQERLAEIDKQRKDAQKTLRDAYNDSKFAQIEAILKQEELNGLTETHRKNIRLLVDGKMEDFEITKKNINRQRDELDVIRKQVEIREHYNDLIETARKTNFEDADKIIKQLEKTRDLMIENVEEEDKSNFKQKEKDKLLQIQNNLRQEALEYETEYNQALEQAKNWYNETLKLIKETSLTTEAEIREQTKLNDIYEQKLETIELERKNRIREKEIEEINKKYEEQIELFNEQIEGVREYKNKYNEILAIQKQSLDNAKIHTLELQLQGATDEQIKEALNEEKRISQEIKQTEEQITAEKEQQIQNMANTVGEMNSLVGSAVSFINILKQGNASISEIMGSLGGIASQFGVYGQIAGGVLSIGSAIASIWEGEEENRKSTLDIQKDLNALMDKHLQLLEKASDAGADVLQSKEEELEYLKQTEKVQKNILIPVTAYSRTAKGIKEFTEEELVYKIKQLETQQALGGELSEMDKIHLEALQQELDTRAQIQDTWEETVKQEMDSFDRQIEAGIKVNKNLQAKLQYMQEILESSKFENMTLEEQRDFYDEMLESIEKLSESNADLAQEQLDALKEQIQAHLNLLEIQKLQLEAQKEMIENSDLPEWAKKIALKGVKNEYDKIITAIDETNNNLKQTEKTELKILEDSKDTALLKLELQGYSKDSLKYIQTQYDYEKQILEQMRAQGASDKDIYEQMLKIKGLANDYAEKLKEINSTTQQTIENELELLSTKSRMLDLQKELGQWDNKITWYYKQKIEIAQRELEILIANKRTNEDVNNILAKQLEIQQLKMEMINEIYDLNLRDIEHKKAIGGYLEDENKYYEDMLNVLYAKMEAMKAEGMEGRELYDIQEQIYDIEHRQTEEILDRNNARDKEMERLIRKRQELLKQYRLTGQGGADLNAIEMEIRARLQSQGIPDDEIEKTMSAFEKQKSYDVGGWVDETGTAMIHKNELILNQEQQKNLIKNLISKPRNNDYGTLAGAMNAANENIYNQYYGNVDYGGIGNGMNQYFNITGTNANEIQKKLVKIVNEFPQMVLGVIKNQGGDFDKLRK